MHSVGSGNPELDKRLKKGARNVFIWTSVWLICTALLAFGPKLLWDFNTKITLVVVVANVLSGVKMLLVNKQHLELMDELQRKIQMNAMAVSLGLTMIFGSLYGLLEPAGLIEYTPNPSNILFVLGISYMVALVINHRKYA